MILKMSADNNKSMKNYQGWKELIPLESFAQDEVEIQLWANTFVSLH